MRSLGDLSRSALRSGDWPSDTKMQARSLAAEDGELPAGSTSPQAPLVLLRVLAHRVEPAMRLLMRVRAAWRRTAWQLEEHAPRVWRT